MHRGLFFKIIFLFLVGATTSCNDEVRTRYSPKPTALGRINDIAVIADKTLWESIAGDEFRYYFGSAYPVMPQPEPMFDIRHFTPEQIIAEPLRRELRTYVIIANLSDTDSEATKMVRRDLGEEKYKKALSDSTYFSTAGTEKWAREQLLVYIFGKDVNDLVRSIKKSYPSIAKRINKHDENQVASNVYSLQGENPVVQKALMEYMGVDMKIPNTYQSKIDLDNNFLLVKRDEPEFAFTLVFRKFPYTNQDQLSKQNMIKYRDEYGKAFITGSDSTSYMVTNVEDLPVYEYTTSVDGAYTKEIRGIWELENDFIGGPFASYGILNEKRNEIVFVDAFIYAPSKLKRDYMQQLDYMIKHLKLVDHSVNNQ